MKGRVGCRCAPLLLLCFCVASARSSQAAPCEPGALAIAGAVAGSVVYTPAKLLLAGTGAVLSLFAAPVSDASASIYTASVHGDYLLTPEQVACDEGPEFFGREQPEVDGAMAGEAVDAPANDAEATAKDAEVTENDDDATEEGVDRSENAPSAGDTQPQT